MCVCVCAHGLAPGAHSPGLGATALVLHGSILAQSLAPCQSSAPLSCPGRDGELGLDGNGEEGDNLARRPTRFRFTVKEDWHQNNTNVEAAALCFLIKADADELNSVGLSASELILIFYGNNKAFYISCRSVFFFFTFTGFSSLAIMTETKHLKTDSSVLFSLF